MSASDDEYFSEMFGSPEDEEEIGGAPDNVPSAAEQSQYAEELGVGARTVRRWEAEAKVLDEVPEIKAEVLEGRKPVKQAVAEAKAEREKPKPKAYITQVKNERRNARSCNPSKTASVSAVSFSSRTNQPLQSS